MPKEKLLSDDQEIEDAEVVDEPQDPNVREINGERVDVTKINPDEIAAALENIAAQYGFEVDRIRLSRKDARTGRRNRYTYGED